MDRFEFEDQFGLTPDQERAVRSLERALKKCRATNVLLHIEHEVLVAFNGNCVREITDEPGDPVIDSDLGYMVENSNYEFNNWTGNGHYVHLHEDMAEDGKHDGRGVKDDGRSG